MTVIEQLDGATAESLYRVLGAAAGQKAKSVSGAITRERVQLDSRRCGR